MTHIYTIEQMRALEQAADAAGHSYDAMMDAAGSGVVAALLPACRWRPRPTLVLVGPGNNGGDGLVVATLLRERGWPVVIYVHHRDETDRRLEEAVAAGATLVRAEEDLGQVALRQVLEESEVVVDALFGTGLSRPIEGLPAAMLTALAEARQQGPQSPLTWVERPPRARLGLYVIAVDTPSGIHGDSGEVDPATVAADVTVTFAGPKQGLLTDGAAPYVGSLVVADIGIPGSVVASAEHVAQCLTPSDVVDFLPRRPPTGHKGTFGTVTVIGGSGNYVGAPALSARAAGRSGAGLVEMAIPASLFPILSTQQVLATVTWRPLPHEQGSLSLDALSALEPSLTRADALVLGPGMGTAAGTQSLVSALLEHEGRPPAVVDADALNMMAQTPAWWSRGAAPLVLTPHPGEMARLLDITISEVQADRRGVARRAAQSWGQVVVLKGAFTVVAAADGRAAIAPYANSALAKAGSGDVLAGMIGGLLAQGATAWQAACLGVVAHGLAGVRVRRQWGGRAALASDLLPQLARVWRALDRMAPSHRNPSGVPA